MTVKLNDNGGTANGGVDTSADADLHDHRQRGQRRASFTKGADQTVNEDAGAQYGHRLGDHHLGRVRPTSSGQTVDFIVSNGNNSLFSATGSLGHRRTAP